MQTFLNLDNSDNEIIYSSENNTVIQSLEKRIKYLIIYGSNKSGKTTIAKKFSINYKIDLIKYVPKDLIFNKETYLDLNTLPAQDENFFHFLQHFITNNIPLTIFTSENSIDNLNDKFYLPDVVSRLKQFTLCNIHNPGKDLLIKLINKYLSFKSISVSEQIINEVLNHASTFSIVSFKSDQSGFTDT